MNVIKKITLDCGCVVALRLDPADYDTVCWEDVEIAGEIDVSCRQHDIIKRIQR